MTSFLPTEKGFLPIWLLLVGIVAVLNSVQAYTNLYFTKRVYSGPDSPVNPLSARTFGTWTFLSAIIRIYCAYNVSDPLMYQLAVWTYGIAFGHFAVEWLWYGTAKFGAGLAGPLLVSTASLLWMVAQWEYYVG